MKPELQEAGLGQGTISREEIASRLREAAFSLVNVMPKETFADGHIPHSVNLPVAEIESRARLLFPLVSQEISIYCAGPT